MFLILTHSVAGVKKKTGGTITLTAGNLPTGFKLVIRLNPSLTQETTFDNGGAFYPEIHEDAFDRQTQFSQSLKDAVDRALKVPTSVSPSDFNPELPANLGANQMIMVNSDGTGLMLGPTPEQISDSVEAVVAAHEAAAAAEQSATDAEVSADEAAANATNAGNYANNAADSAVAAANSASDANDSADAAETSADQAASHDILYGSGVPSSGLGVDGNSYIDQLDGSFYRKESGGWILKITLTGSSGVTLFGPSGNKRAGNVTPLDGDYTKANVGLGNVDNTSDLNKPISTAAQSALDLKADAADLDDAILDISTLQSDVTDLGLDVAALESKEVPPGGTTGQVLKKTTGTDYDFEWADETGSGPLTTKGDIYTYSTTIDRLPVGTNGQTLVADSSQSTGLEWQTPGPSLPVGGSTGQVLTKTLVQTVMLVGPRLY